MVTNKNIKRRITTLYIVFFAVLAASVAVTTGIGSAAGSLRTGINDARFVHELEKNNVSTSVFFDIPNTTYSHRHDIGIGDGGRHQVMGRISGMDIIVAAPTPEGQNGAKTGSDIAYILALVSYVAIFVLVFLLISSLRRSNGTDGIFRPGNIMRLRAIGICLIAASLFFSLSRFLECRYLAPLVESGSFSVDTSFRLSFVEIITGILVFVMAEIFAIGNTMAEEEKLTI